MAIPESQLETWSHQGSIAQSRDTYASVKRGLEAPTAAYAKQAFKVFLQGSYANDSNTYDESDVDVVIRLDSIFYYDTSALSPAELAAFNAALIPGSYPYKAYKADVIAAVTDAFGAHAVTIGKRALRIQANGARRSADVIVAADFRRYRSSGLIANTLAGVANPDYERGICFFTTTGERIENYPEQHSANCTAKHQATNGWFKPMVRIFKNMRRKLVSDGVVDSKCAPSYFIEGLLYNVPNDKFGGTYAETFAAAMAWLLAAKRVEWICANRQHFLVRDSFATCWPCANCDLFLNSLVKLWDGYKPRIRFL
ncbi:MAG: nucleotidyltransferase domain-containing protein [Candidatus Acidiferrales bacterium]